MAKRKRTKSQQARLSRTKGGEGERAAAKAWTEILGVEVKRRLGQARDSGHDLDTRNVPFIIEVKRCRGMKTLYRWMQQALRAMAKGGAGVVPLIDLRADNEEALVVVRRSDVPRFAEIIVDTAVNPLDYEDGDKPQSD